MQQQDYHCSFTAAVTPKEAFEGINNISGWWAKHLEGSTKELHDIFTARFGETFVTMKIIESIPGKKIVWQVTDCNLHWQDDKTEWNDTRIVWEITAADGAVRIDMTHIGLVTMLYYLPSLDQTLVMYDNTGGHRPFDLAFAVMNLFNHHEASPLVFKTSLARLYGKELMERGPDEAMTLFNNRKTDTADYIMTKRDFNLLGYDFLHNGHLPQALETFKINTLLYPFEASVYDSYAEALAASGKKEAAILMYKKSLLIDPDNENGQKMLKELLDPGVTGH